MLEQKNYGVIIEQKPEDWVAGSIEYKENVSDGEWNKYLPTKECQLKNRFETFACMTFSALNAIEIQINRMIKENLIPITQLQKIKDYGYLDENGNADFSDCYIAKLSDTEYRDGETKGNTVQKVYDTINKYGLVPQSVFNRDNAKDLNEWYAKIPKDIIEYGKKFFEIFEKIQYERIVYSNCGQPNSKIIYYHLKQSPLSLAAHVPEYQKNNVLYNSSCICQHATTIYNIDYDNYYQLDQYNPYYNKLSANYVMPYIYKSVVLLKPETNNVEEQKIALLQKIVELYKKIIEFLIK